MTQFKKQDTEKQIFNKEYNISINNTFAINQSQRTLSQPKRKVEANNYRKKSSQQIIQELSEKQSQKILNDYGMSQEVKENIITFSGKVNFRRSQFSQSEGLTIKVEDTNQIKKSSKAVSSSNGHFSGYFNEQQDEQNGLNFNKKQIRKNKTISKQNTFQHSLLRPIQKSKLLSLAYANQKAQPIMIDRVNSAKQTSRIQIVYPPQIDTSHDFQLAKVKDHEAVKRPNKPIKSNNFNESRLFLNYKLDLSYKIKDHQSFQMIQSHYRTDQIQRDVLYRQQNGKEINFAEIGEVNKQIIQERNCSLSPFDYSDREKKKNKMLNLKQFRNCIATENSRRKKVLMQILSQRNTRKCIQEYLLQRQKNKLIKNLNLKSKKLQSQQIVIQEELSRMKEQLKSMSIENYSQRHNTQYRGQCSCQNISRNDFNRIKNSQSSNQNNSLYQEIDPDSQSQKSNRNYQTVDGKLNLQNHVNLQAYDQFLQNLNSNIIKKNCLKNKSLVYVSEDMEIGCMSFKKQKFINFTLFITPKKLSMSNVKVKIDDDKKLSINVFPDIIYSIKAKKQQTINIKIFVQNVPFIIQKVKIEYKIQTGNSIKNNSLKKQTRDSIQIILPFTFNKICSFQKINTKDFCAMFTSGQNTNDIRKTQIFRINTKIFREQKVKQDFPYMCFLYKNEVITANKYKVMFGFQVSYNSNIFLVVLRVQDKKYAVIGTKNMTGQRKTQKYIQFFMATFKSLLSY